MQTSAGWVTCPGVKVGPKGFFSSHTFSPLHVAGNGAKVGSIVVSSAASVVVVVVGIVVVVVVVVAHEHVTDHIALGICIQ